MVKLETFKFIVGFIVVVMFICVLIAYACIDIASKADDQEEEMIGKLKKEKEESKDNLDKGDM